jgi:hypothetical protein
VIMAGRSKEYYDTLDLAWRAVDALGGTGASQDYSDALDAAIGAVENIGGMDAYGRKTRGYPSSAPQDDEGPYFRAYMFAAGRTLSSSDVNDIQQVLAEHNDLIGEASDAFDLGGLDMLRRIGGQELVDAVKAEDQARINVYVAKAMEKFRAAREEA